MPKKKNNPRFINLKLALIIAPALLISGFAGYFWGIAHAPAVETSHTLVPGQRSQLAEFNAKFRDKLTHCDVGDNRAPDDRSKEYDRQLQINTSADRIIARSCNDFDTLYFIDANGQWQPSAVNIISGRKHYYKWLEACGIDDIQTPTEKARSENSSIDEYNLHECTYINEHKQLPPDSLLNIQGATR